MKTPTDIHDRSLYISPGQIDLGDDKTKELVLPFVELGFFKFLRIILSGHTDIGVYI